MIGALRLPGPAGYTPIEGAVTAGVAAVAPALVLEADWPEGEAPWASADWTIAVSDSKTARTETCLIIGWVGCWEFGRKFLFGF